MTYRQLSNDILSKLVKRTGRKEGTIRKDISLLREKYGSLPINTLAQIYAIKNHTTVYAKLTKEEKSKLPNIEIEKPVKVIKKQPKLQKKKLLTFVKYQTNDSFIKAHVEEVNKTYTCGCYTAVFILTRKIIENLLTDLIRKKFPSNKKENIELYFDTAKGRTKDFSDILKNLRDKSSSFDTEKKLVERIVNRADQFKDKANDKAHSWYHIVRSRTELDETHIQDIIDMISDLEKKI